MGVGLGEIKTLLSYRSLPELVSALKAVERETDEKIRAMEEARSHLQRARRHYEGKTKEQLRSHNPLIRSFPTRTILLSTTLRTPSTENLYQYLDPFFQQLPPSLRSEFQFEDQAGINREWDRSALFALCRRSLPVEGLRTIEGGDLLCADCEEEGREETRERLLSLARREHSASPSFTLEWIRISGILHWSYEIQVPLSSPKTRREGKDAC